MTTDSLVGSNAVRWATGTLLTLWLLSVLAYTRDVFPDRSDVTFGLLIGSGILTFMGFVHTTRAIYSQWLRFAAALHSVVITVLFGSIYLFIVPLFALAIWPFDVLRLRKHGRTDTFWIRKRSIGGDIAFFQRTG